MKKSKNCLLDKIMKVRCGNAMIQNWDFAKSNKRISGRGERNLT